MGHPSRGLFKHKLTSLLKLNPVLLRLLEEFLIYSFFIFRTYQWCKKSIQKEKLQSREQNVCAQWTSFSAIFILNKIRAPTLQIIHVRNKTLDPCISGQQRS